MKVYYDIFTNEEVISDAYEMTEVFDGMGFEVAARYSGEDRCDVENNGKLIFYFFK